MAINQEQDQDNEYNGVEITETPEARTARFKAKYAALMTLDMIKEQDRLQKEKERLEAELKKINLEFDYVRIIAVPERFEIEGIQNMKVNGIGRVSLTGDMHVQVLAENRDKVYEWFDDIGKGSIITKIINPSTLKATIKAMIKTGQSINEELIKVTPFTRATITRK